MNYQALIRSNNIIWKLLYYDELIDYPYYQLTYFTQADQGYYNCAQAITRLSKNDLMLIEKYYHKRKVSPAFYTDPVSESWLPRLLRRHGYQEIESQNENWWIIQLTDHKLSQLDKLELLKIDNNMVGLDMVKTDVQLNEFLNINRLTNQLTFPIIESLERNIKNTQQDGASLINFLGKVNNMSVSCGSLGLIRDYAFMAEDGTLPDYRQKGLHSYITQQRLLYAYKLGAKLACMTCSLDSNTNKTAKKLGFSLAFKRIFMSKEKM